MQAVILAGGLATRMRPMTLTIPKAMLDVAGRPFIDWQLEKLKSAGFSEVIMCVAHLGEQIRANVGNGARFGLRVRYSEEGPKLMGTGGALRKALERLDDTFLVTYGDSYLPFDYAAPLRLLDSAEGAHCDGVMSVFRNEGKWEASNVATDGAFILRYEKGVNDPAFDHIDYGAIALRRSVVEAIPEDQPSGLDAVQTRLARERKLLACVAAERFFEIGSPEGLLALKNHLLP